MEKYLAWAQKGGKRSSSVQLVEVSEVISCSGWYQGDR